MARRWISSKGKKYLEIINVQNLLQHLIMVDTRGEQVRIVLTSGREIYLDAEPGDKLLDALIESMGPSPRLVVLDAKDSIKEGLRVKEGREARG